MIPKLIGQTRKHTTLEFSMGGTITLFSDGEVTIHTPCGEVCIGPVDWKAFMVCTSAVEMLKLKPEFNAPGERRGEQPKA